MRRRNAFALGIAVSVLFLWLAFRNADPAAIREALADADFALALPFLLCLFAFYWLKSARWRWLLYPDADIPTRELFPIVMVGYAGTAVLPMQMGEFVRAYIAGKRYSLGYSQVLSTIAMERIFDLLTILALLGFVLATGQSTPDVLINAGFVIAAITLFGLGVAILLVTRRESVLALLRRPLSLLPERVGNFVLEQLEIAARGLESIRQPRLILRIAVNSILQWGLMGICIWLSLIALDIDVPTSGVVLVLVATIVGISLPTSPGYVGNIQLAFVVALQPFGIGDDAAIAASVFYHLLAYVAVVVVGFACLHRMGFAIADIRAQAAGNETS